MPWVCFKDEVVIGATYSLYNVQVCGGRTMQAWGYPEIPPGNCASPGYPSCFFYPDDPNSRELLEKQTILRHPDLTDEQNKEIDRISDLIAYQRMNEPDSDDKKNKGH